MKQFTSVILCLVMLLSLWCMPVSAHENMNATAHCFDYEVLEDGTICITGYTPDPEDTSSLLLIPSQIGGYTVSAIGDIAFLRAGGIETVVIPGTVKTIGLGAFQETLIKRVFIQEGVEEICDQAFFNCTFLETLVIPSSIKNIGEHAIGFAWYTDPDYPDLIPGTPDVIPEFTMYADGNEVASAYAAETGVAFVELADVRVGDIDFDGTAGTKDVRTMLRYTMVSDIMYCLDDWRNVDVNGDGDFNTTDARELLVYRLMNSEEQKDRLLAFETPRNSNLTSEELQSNCVGKVIQTYDEFEEACAKICYAFYTPYESEDGSFDAWKQTITPAYFETKSLLIVSHGTHARRFELDYAVSDDTVAVTVTESNPIGFGNLEVWQLVIEIDNNDLVGREVSFNTVMVWE